VAVRTTSDLFEALHKALPNDTAAWMVRNRAPVLVQLNEAMRRLPRKSDRYTMTDVFAGGGLLALAGFIEGYDLQELVECDAAAVETLDRQLPGKAKQADATKWTPDIPRGGLDVLTGGPPCQGWSTAGRQLGPLDPRNLFPEVIRWAREGQPRVIVMENSPNTVRAGKWSAYWDVWWKTLADEAGYEGTVWVLKAASFGTPQTRERAFYVLWPKGAPWASYLRAGPRPTRLDPRSIPYGSANVYTRAFDRLNDGCCGGFGYSSCVNIGNLDGMCGGCKMGSNYEQADNDVIRDELTPKSIAYLNRELTDGRNRLKLQGFIDYGGAFANWWPTGKRDALVGRWLAPAMTKSMYKGIPYGITVEPGHQPEGKKGALSPELGEVRQLTPREAAKLQDVPSWYVFAGGQAEEYKQVGNGIPVNMGRAVLAHVRNALQQADGRRPGPPAGSMSAGTDQGLFPLGDLSICSNLGDSGMGGSRTQAVQPPVYFASGATRSAEIAALGAAGQAVGVAVTELTKASVGALLDIASAVPVFVDSGAFSEVEFTATGPAWDAAKAPNWPEVLGVYNRLASRWPAHAPGLFLVAPDRVADPAHTVKLWDRYAPELRALGAFAPVRLIVPLQRGGKWDQAKMWNAASKELRGATLVAGIPSKKDATTIEELGAFLRAVRKSPPNAFHFLGLAPGAPGAQERLSMVREAYPRAEVYFDSVYLRGKVGNRHHPGPYMKTKDTARRDVAETRWAPGGSMDGTEVESDLDWMTKAARHRLASALVKAYNPPRKVAQAWRRAMAADPTEFMQADAPNDSPWYMDQVFHQAMETEIRAEAHTLETPAVTRQAVREVIAGDPKAGLWKRYSPKTPTKRSRPAGLPSDLPDQAAQLVSTAKNWLGQPEASWAWEALAGKTDDETSTEAMETVLGTMGLNADKALDRSVAVHAFKLAMETDPGRWDGSPFGDPIYRHTGGKKHDTGRTRDDASRNDDQTLPTWLAVASMADMLTYLAVGEAGKKLRLAPVDREAARAFLAAHHSQLKQLPRRTMYALGAFRGDRLVAVATAGHPSAPWKRLDQRNVLELTRIASDGSVAGASSMLASAVLQAAPASKRGDADGPWLFVTYSLESEGGHTYKALKSQGLRPVALIGGKRGKQGARSAASVQAAKGTTRKIRWEAGPVAGAARWDLLGRES